MVYITLLIILLIAAINDHLKYKIPNILFPISLSIFLVFLLLGFLNKSLYHTALDFIIIFTPLLILWALGTLTSFKPLGAGDVKLISIFPLFITLRETIFIFMGALIILSLFNILRLKKSNFYNSAKDINLFIFYGIPGPLEPKYQTRVAFAPYLFLAYLIMILYPIFF